MDTPQFPEGSRVLRLTLKKAPFDVMLTGEKPYEYRKPTKWILSRLDGKDYDYVLFTNGYGAHLPWFSADWLGWDIALNTTQLEYSNGLIVNLECGDLALRLGRIHSSGNLSVSPTP